MQHASRNTQATGILLFFSSSSLSLFFSFFRLPPRPCAFSTRSNFPIQKLRVGRKSRERTLARRFDKFLSHISIHRISILRILIFDIYFILRKKKYVIRTLEEEERKCPTTRSFLPLEDRPPSLFSPFLPSLRPFLAPSRY